MAIERTKLLAVQKELRGYIERYDSIVKYVKQARDSWSAFGLVLPAKYRKPITNALNFVCNIGPVLKKADAAFEAIL